MDRYLITGAAGHLGNALIIQLQKEGKALRGLFQKGERNLPEGNYEIFYGDVCDKGSLKPFFSGLEGDRVFLIHCAGIVSIASRFLQKVYDVNVIGTKNIVDLCLEHRVHRLIYVSSVHAIPEKPQGEIITETDIFHPYEVVGLYAKTKSEATAYVLAASKRGLEVNVVHPSGICGPYDNGRGHLTTLVLDYCKGRLTAGMDGGYDFVDVRDVADGILSCCGKGQPGSCYILSNRYFTVREILEMLHEVTGRRSIRTYLPRWFVKLTAPLAETYYRILRQPPLFTAYSIYTLSTNSVFSHQKATDELGYTTRAMGQTLKDTVEWLQGKHRLD